MKKFLMAAPLAIAISLLGGMLGFNSNVGAAAPSTTDTNIDLTAAGWVKDRTLPANYSNTTYQGLNSLKIDIEKTSFPDNLTNYWYNWEGLKQSAGINADTISGYIYTVTSTGDNFNGGIWTEAYSAAGAQSAWPMVQYCGDTSGCFINDGRVDAQKSFDYGWNLYDNGVWVNIGGASDGWHRVDITISATGTIIYYIDNVNVGELYAAASNSSYFASVMLNSYNDGRGDYSVYFAGLQAGIYNKVENTVAVTDTTTNVSNDGTAEVTIDRTNDSSAVAKEDVTYTIDAVDAAGGIVDTKTVTVGSGEIGSVTFTDLAPGVYTFRVNGVSESEVTSSWLSDEYTIAAGPAPTPTPTSTTTQLTAPQTGVKQAQTNDTSSVFAILIGALMLAGIGAVRLKSDSIL